MKMTQKEPGLKSSTDLLQAELDLTYKERFGTASLPDAYERLILDAIRGDHSLFVRNDELEASWKISKLPLFPHFPPSPSPSFSLLPLTTSRYSHQYYTSLIIQKKLHWY